MWKRFKEYFKLNPREARGLGAFMLLLVVLQGFIVLKDHFYKTPTPTWTFEWLPTDSLENNAFIASKTKNQSYERKYTPFALDLNSASIEDLQATGLTQRQATTLVKYRNRGGKFFSFEDVEKVYGLSDEWLKTMKPYLVYPNLKKLNSEFAAELITEPFDPNVADSLTLYQAGYKPWQIVNINRFRNRGGIFHVKEDLLKLYNVDSAHFYRIQDFVIINKAQKSVVSKVEINTADSVTLIKVKGIGPATASRLIKLRVQCGGIATAQQLFDIYGMDTARYEQIVAQISIDESYVKKLNINTASEAELAAHPYISKTHPYISKTHAKEIVNFRKKFQFYQNIEDINKLSSARPELFTKLAPYLTTGK